MQRSADRKPINAEVQLRRSGELSYMVHAYDLSERGCKIEFIECPQEGEIVWVKFNGIEALESAVRWTSDFTAGLEFSHPIDGRVLDVLLPRLR